jgi:hypothetical protein
MYYGCGMRPTTSIAVENVSNLKRIDWHSKQGFGDFARCPCKRVFVGTLWCHGSRPTWRRHVSDCMSESKVKYIKPLLLLTKLTQMWTKHGRKAMDLNLSLFSCTGFILPGPIPAPVVSGSCGFYFLSRTWPFSHVNSNTKFGVGGNRTCVPILISKCHIESNRVWTVQFGQNVVCSKDLPTTRVFVPQIGMISKAGRCVF